MTIRRTTGLCATVLTAAVAAARADQGNRGAWGDQGDGTYKNPILPGDFSDPDVIRDSDDYYLITSTFQYAPGQAILTSKDMVNWRYLGACIPDVSQIGPSMTWANMAEYNRGVYAGSIRAHAGRFYMYTTTMGQGMFMTSAPAMTGPWDPLTRVSDRTGCDDDCPFWDDDGRAYLIFSTPGKQWRTRMVDMSPDGKSIDPASETVIDDYQTSEGNKIYKIGSTYYIFHNEVRGGGNRVGVMMRSGHVRGPYEKREILHGGGKDHEREPNQGALVQAKDGTWWFLTHQGRGGNFDGRPVSLLPVRWVDGWPIPGRVDATGAGNMVWSWRKPIDGFPITVPQSSDEFAGPTLGPQWEWNHQPRDGMWSLTERPGFLRLRAFKPLGPSTARREAFFTAGDTLTQRVMGYSGGVVTAKLDVSAAADGMVGGLALFHGKVCRLGVVQQAGVRTVEFNDNGKPVAGPTLTRPDLWVRAVIGDEPKPLARFSYSVDGTAFTPIGDPFQLDWANYRGSRLALYCYNPDAEAGRLDVDWLHYDYPNPLHPAWKPSTQP
jgi:hypothetical protein